MARRQLGEVLVAAGIVTAGQIDDALLLQQTAPQRLRLGRILVQEGIIDEETLAQALAQAHGLECVNLEQLDVLPQVARLLPRAVANRYSVVPIREDATQLTVAVSDPVDVVALDELRARLPDHKLVTVVAPAHQIQDLVSHAWSEEQSRLLSAQFVRQPEVRAQTAPDRMDAADTDEGASALVTQLLELAARRRASDVHLEPQTHHVRVRLRIDGIMRELMQLPTDSMTTLSARIKIISGLDVFERRLPQDGRTQLRIGDLSRDVRVSTLPTIHGEKIVMRLLPSQTTLPALEDLGLTEPQRAVLRRTLRQPQGLVIVTGPTGAGKSNTMYASLIDTVDDQRNVITVEDPVEVELDGITQVQVNEAIGVTFEKTLRAALRQDPDVLMVGEIRDMETGILALRAALTGHLVMSTLHTLDAPSSVARLVDLGLPRFMVATAVSLVLAQRLVRRVCPACREYRRPDADVCARLGIPDDVAERLVAGAGCASCSHTGYRGRIGVFEVMNVDDPFRKAVAEGRDEQHLRELARNAGWRPVLEQGLRLAVAGVTTPEEVLRAVTTEID